MYYIINNFGQYYAGKCCSDNKTSVWKNHWTRAVSFRGIEGAIEFAEAEGVDYEDIEFIREGD